MDKKNNLGFFSKLILSITDFRLYPHVVKNEKFKKSFGYFIKLLLLIVAVITFKYVYRLNYLLGDFIENYDSIMPEFTLVSGELIMPNTMTSKLSDGIGFVLNTDYTFEEFKNTSHYDEVTKYDARILVNSDGIVYENYAGGYNKIISFEQITETYDKTLFYELIKALDKDFSYKFVVASSIFISMFIIFLSYKMLDVLLYTMFASLISVIGGMKIDYKNYLKIVLYSLTLPFIVETVSILYADGLKDYTIVVSNILAFVYIYYAIRAVKLDAFLLIISNRKNAKKGEQPNSIIVDLNETLKKEIEKKDNSEEEENKDESEHNNSEK